MNKKYHDCKTAYLQLKGGMIDENRKLQSTDVILSFEEHPITKVALNIENEHELDELKLSISVKSWGEIAGDNNNYVWTYDISKSAVFLLPRFKNKFRDDTYSYYWYRQYTMVYTMPVGDVSRSQIQGIVRSQNHFEPKHMDPDEPYTFEPIIDIFGAKIELFKNIFSIPIQRDLIDPIILEWMRKIVEPINERRGTKMKITPYPLNTNQPAIKFVDNDNDRPMIKSDIKIHICVKTEYVFWTFHKLLSNIERFITGNKSIISDVKLLASFANNNYLGEYIDIWPNPLNDNKNTYVFDEKEYKKEQTFEASFAFYPYMIQNSDANRKTVQEIIRILLDLFPDSLGNIASNQYPRFNFKINNCIYIAFGDGDQKEKYGEMGTFAQPIEYRNINCEETKEEDSCMGFNRLSTHTSMTKLCIYDEDGCKENNILSKHKLVFQNTPEFLLVKDDDGNDLHLNSVENIYKYIGIPIPM